MLLQVRPQHVPLVNRGRQPVRVIQGLRNVAQVVDKYRFHGHAGINVDFQFAGDAVFFQVGAQDIVLFDLDRKAVLLVQGTGGVPKIVYKEGLPGHACISIDVQ